MFTVEVPVLKVNRLRCVAVDPKLIGLEDPFMVTVLEPRLRVLDPPEDALIVATVRLKLLVLSVPFKRNRASLLPRFSASVIDQPAPIPSTCIEPPPSPWKTTPFDVNVLLVVDPERTMGEVKDLVNPVDGKTVLPCTTRRLAVEEDASVMLPEAGPAIVNWLHRAGTLRVTV